MPCIWVKEALAVKGNKFKLEDISLNAPVADLKTKLSESSGIDEKLHGISQNLYNVNKVLTLLTLVNEGAVLG